MKILQILPELKSGGVERGTVDLAKYLVKTGHQAVVVSAGGPLVGDLTSAGVTHYALPVHRKSLFSIYKSIKALIKIVQHESVDVIHARSRVPALIAFFVSRQTNVPFVNTCHGFYSKHALSRVMGWSKLVIVASHIIGKRMRDDFGVPQKKIRLIHRGVNLQEFPYRESAPEGQLIVGMVGRITPIKGHSFFLKAMSRVARVYPNVKIQIIGDAPKLQYKQELVALTRHLGLTANVEFLGTRYDIPQLLSKMTVLAVPSVGEEAFGRVAIEAGSCGVPVVATRMGGLVDIIEDEKDGLLVPPDDPRLLADAVIRLLKEPLLAKTLSTNLRAKVQSQFNLETMFEKTVDVYREVVNKKKILIIKLSAMGDVILSIPSIRAIRQKFPQSHIAVLVGRKARNIVRNCPYVDDTISFDPDACDDKWTAILKTAKILAHQDFDIVVDLQNNKTSHILSYLSGARLRAGHKNGKWAFLLNRKTSESKAPIAPLEHQYQVLGLIGVEPDEKRLELWTTGNEEKRVDQFLAAHWVSPSQVLVGINPGSSLRWPTKQWPLENFAKLCDEFARINIRVVITGSKEDAPQAEALLKLTRNKPINAVGKTSITELVSLIKRCRVFISSDSAPMHISSSVDIPTLALFGPTDPKRHFVAPSKYEVFWKGVQCSPCYLRSCPIGHICMNQIEVHEVFESAMRFCKEAKPASLGKEPELFGAFQ